MIPHYAATFRPAQLRESEQLLKRERTAAGLEAAALPCAERSVGRGLHELAEELGGDAAATIGRDARTGVSRAAAPDAARAALAPIIEDLQSSAFSLLDPMLATAPLAVPVASATSAVHASTALAT